VAIANNGDRTLAIPPPEKGETFTQLLTCLDQAIAAAFTEDIFIDVINS